MISTSKSSQLQQTATDNAKILGKGSTLTESGSFALGKGSKYIEPGALSLEKGATLKTATDLSGAKLEGATINIGDDGGAVQSLGQMFSELFKAQSAETRSLLGSLAPVVQAGAPPVSSAENGAPVSNGKKVLVAGAGLLLLLAFIVFRKR